MKMVAYRFVRSAFAGLLLPAVAALTACGGGGGGGDATNTVAAPTVSISLSAAKASVSSPVTVTWSSTGATSCQGADAWSGAQATSGSATITPSIGGQFKYTLQCTGAGGTAKQSSTLIVPIPVQRTSYLNAKNINIGPQSTPIGIGFVTNEGITAGRQYADFFQDGTIAMIGASNVFAGQNGFGSTVAGRIYFFHTDGNGGWVDQTEKLIKDRTGCISPRKVIVADFNGDGVPDVFIACAGIDGNIPPGYSDGEDARYLLSQPDGTYKNLDTGVRCYCHGASAADFNNDGFADVIATDPNINRQVIYLKNNHDTTFTKRLDLTPAGTFNKALYSLELIDVNNDGKQDLVLLGSEQSTGGLLGQPWDYQSVIFFNDGSNVFTDGKQTLSMPTDASATNVLDIIVKDSKIAVLRTNLDGSKLMVDIYAFPTMTVISSTAVPVADTVWFILYNGNIVDLFSSNPYSVPF